MMEMMSKYAVHPMYPYAETIAANLLPKTGKSIEEWLQIVAADGPGTEKERIAWLKSEHGLGATQALVVAQRADGGGTIESYKPEKLVEEMYAGKKQPLLPIYEALLDLCLGQGPDAKACPCATIVPVFRNRVFAQIKPTTATRIDLGLALGTHPFEARLLDTGGLAKKDRITHRIPILSVDEIDDYVRARVRAAYNLEGGI